jgi:hypothetical protein
MNHKEQVHYYTVATEIPDRKCRATDTVYSIRATSTFSKGLEDWETLDNPYGKGRNWKNTRTLSNIRKSIDQRSKRYRDGWSSSLNFTTESFFSNFQYNYINWSLLWPNTRTQRSDTTHTDGLTECCIIEVDLENVVEVDESTLEAPDIVRLEVTVVGELTRKEI